MNQLTRFALLAMLSIVESTARADLVLETETAQLGKQGTFATSAGVQLEHDKDGNITLFTLNQFEYAITDRAEILIEPFFWEKTWMKDGSARVEGVGDLEITPSYLAIEETESTPAVVLAFKFKVPMATNRDIGSGEWDYNPFVIIGKTSGPWIFNLNLGYDFIAPTSDENLRDQFIVAASAEYIIQENWSVYVEAFGNSSPVEGEHETAAAALATEYRFNENSNAFISVGYDTDRMSNVRFGFNLEW